MRKMFDRSNGKFKKDKTLLLDALFQFKVWQHCSTTNDLFLLSLGILNSLYCISTFAISSLVRTS